MEYCIVVFWSRSEAYYFSNMLKRFEISSQLIPTPYEAGRTCGLSVKIFPEDLDISKKIVAKNNFSSFGGILKYSFRDGKKIVSKA